MSKPRISLQKAQKVWDDIKSKITLASIDGKRTKLPDIDLQILFAGRKTMNEKDVEEYICAFIDKI